MYLPEAFIEKMKKQLPQTEWEAFFDVYTQKAYKGLRLNLLKGDLERLKSKFPFLQERVAWESCGFYHEEEKLGANPYYMAGLAYSQEPSAMSAAPLLDVQPGDRVLDLCSAPGGKGTQLACRMQGKGIVVLNEPIFSRAKILSQNVERLGITNAVVCSEFPERIAKKFAGYFDKVLVDAPCSGEGMFRKNTEEAIGEWSEENVELCAKRQAEILDEATKVLRMGGKLVYSTCTFAVEEDELQIENYLQRHGEMRLIKQEKLYPHTSKGEGHFVALLQKTDEGADCRIQPLKPRINAASEKLYRQFEKAFFKQPFAKTLHEVDGTLYALPDGAFDWSGIQVLRAGVRLGEVKNGRFEPNHSLAMAVNECICQNVVRLDGAEIERYLRGETVERTDVSGWCLVCVEEFPLGLGKASGGVVKNHLPKGLRVRV